MVLIFLSWIIMLFFFVPCGIITKKMLSVQTNDFLVTVFLGMFFQSFVLSICCFFTNIGIFVFIANAIFSMIFIFFYKNEIQIFLKNVFQNWIQVSVYSKILLIITLISSLYKCSQKPFLIDNESYYIQTIKWINEYGFVKGLANLHIFFAQTSVLHVLQAGFNFSFWNDNFNDINGFILVISSVFFVFKAEKYYLRQKQFHWLNFVLIFNILFFQFIGQPSPDFVLIVVSQIIFYFFVEETANNQALKISILLFLFLFFVKITIAPIGLLIFIWIVKLKKHFIFFFLSSSFILLILFFKNSIISGYPLYPFHFFSLEVDWKIPNNIFEFITNSTKNTGYFENQFVDNPTFLQKINAWLHLSGLNRIFNWGILILFFLSLFTTQIRRNKNYKTLFLVLFLHFVILLFTSPQYRFFLPEFLFFSLLIASNWVNYLKLNFQKVQIMLILAVLISTVFIETYDYKNFTNNKLMQSRGHFRAINFLYPENNSKYDYLKFKKIKNGNLEYYSPAQNFFFFGTANGKLPCVNEFQIDYLEKYYFAVPQLRSQNMGNGFYSKISKTYPN